ncbi:MurR/RpiR family transcriptional regulator [Clostridium chrysemydis]|uniref:MurR/RpiR family transcriptional regulator n=1 Tax=Clostridium chrysemydis TaxID=2665504 RepID=UPI0018834325|nr:MurR/RpiR family transcriptional regulator [Clostridium chrysemydis]
MGIIDRIKKNDYKKSKNDILLEEYIEEKRNECVYKSISEIAKGAKTSEATVTRFTKKLGFSGFQEFKVTLAKVISKENGKSIISAAVDINESVQNTSKTILESNKLVLDKTFEELDFNKIVEIRELILGAKRILFFGIGNSGISAMDANYKFMRIGLNTTTVTDNHTMLMMSSLISREDLVFCISYTGETKELIEALNLVKENKCKIISITSNVRNTIMDMSDVNLSYVGVETKFETGSIMSKLTQGFLVELIYAEVIKEVYEEAIENKIKTTNSIER